MSYYTRVKGFLTGTTAKGADVKDEFDAVQAGFALVQDDFDNFGELNQAVLDAETAEYNAQQWAERPEDSDIPTDPGSYSALHHAAKAAASAIQAALFDPANFYLRTWIDANIYTITEVDSLNSNKVSKIDTNWYPVGSAYTATVRQKVWAISSGGSFVITLPASPQPGEWVKIGIGDATNTVDINPGSYQIEGGGAGVVMTIDISNIEFELGFDGSNWRVFG